MGIGWWDFFFNPTFCILRICDPFFILKEKLCNWIKNPKNTRTGIEISYADRWFPVTNNSICASKEHIQKEGCKYEYLHSLKVVSKSEYEYPHSLKVVSKSEYENPHSLKVVSKCKYEYPHSLKVVSKCK